MNKSSKNKKNSILTFSCTGCGICCKEKGYVFFSDDDIKRASKYLEISPLIFINQYLEYEEGYGYYINNQLFEKYIVNKMDVDIEQYLQLNQPKTESEIFLRDLYYKHKKSYYEHKKDNKDIVIGKGEIYRIKPIKFIV